jgi:ABC-2 type transport system permease protein
MSVAVPTRITPGQRIGHAFGDGLIVARRNIVQLYRVPVVFIFELVQPVMFVILFRYVFAGNITNLPPGVDYVSFLMPGIIVQNAIFGSTSTALGIADDLKKGLIDRFRSLPMARSAVLTGRTGADLGKSFILTWLVLGVGYLVGFRITQGLPGVIGLVITTLAVGYTFSWISATIGLSLKNVEAVQAASFTWIFPVVFISSALVPVEGMAPAFQWFAERNPVTYWANLARYFALGEAGIVDAQTGQPVATFEELLVISLIWMIAILAVFVPLSIRLYRRLT